MLVSDLGWDNLQPHLCREGPVPSMPNLLIFLNRLVERLLLVDTDAPQSSNVLRNGIADTIRVRSESARGPGPLLLIAMIKQPDDHLFGRALRGTPRAERLVQPGARSTILSRACPEFKQGNHTFQILQGNSD